MEENNKIADQEVERQTVQNDALDHSDGEDKNRQRELKFMIEVIKNLRQQNKNLDRLKLYTFLIMLMVVVMPLIMFLLMILVM